MENLRYTLEDHTKRFSGRADVYSKYRPTYPERVLDILRSEINFDQSKIVADIGSGTGILSRLFLKNGNTVFGVEPNDDMRKTAEEDLHEFPQFFSVKGTAEESTLASNSIDFVAVGQALHWFRPEETWKEFIRIAKKDGVGILCIIYNDRKSNAGGIMSEYENLIERYARNKPRLERIEDENLVAFFPEWRFRKFAMPNEQMLDLEGFLGRAISASYMPKPGEESFPRMKDDLRVIFDRYEKGGRITFYYDTNIFLGNL
jgi:SAM-dependent methyltransferase